MRILELCAELASVGGVEGYLRRAAAGLAARGHAVKVIGGSGDAAGWPAPTGVAVVAAGAHEFGAPDALAAEALRLAAEFRPDVVRIHEVDNYPLVLELARRWPCVKHAHVDFACAAGGRRFWRRVRRACPRPLSLRCLWHYYADRCGPAKSPRYALWSYRRARGALETWPRMRKILVASEFMRRSLITAGIGQDAIEVLPYFVPDEAAAPREAEVSGTPEILFVGRVMPEKGLDDLVRAVPLLKSACRLAVVGDGPALYGARRLAGRLGLGPRAEFAGWREDVEPYWRRASVLAVPSLWPEPSGIVGLEAMARALPVVAYRSGGIPEWLIDGVTGKLVEPGDVAGLAAAIDALLADSPLARRLGAAGQARQRELFGPARHLEQLERMLQAAAR